MDFSAEASEAAAACSSRIVTAAKRLVEVDAYLSALNCNSFLASEFEEAFSDLCDAVRNTVANA